MGIFRYEAVDKTGKVVHGAMNAADEQQVAQNLSRMGYSVRAVHAPAGVQPQAARPAAATAAPAQAPPRTGAGIQTVTVGTGVPVSVRSCVALPVLARFFRQLATLVKSGMSINQALQEMEPLVHNGHLRRILFRMQETTSGGRSLSSLMAEHPRVFPVHAIASVWSGELAGRLEIALLEVAEDLEQETSDVRYGRFGWGLTKINWLFFIFLIPACDVVNLLVPVLSKTLESAGGMSKAAVLREVLRVYMQDMFWRSFALSVAMVLAWIAWGYVKRMPVAKRILDGALLYVPVWGPLHRARALSRFTHVLDGLYSAGISPGAAWDAASLTVKNSAIAEKLKLARQVCPPAAGVSDLFAASGVFGHEDVAYAVTGEKAGQVPDVLSSMSANHAGQAASLKTTGKTVAILVMTIFGLALGVYAMYKFTVGYVDLAFKAADMMK